MGPAYAAAHKRQEGSGGCGRLDLGLERAKVQPAAPVHRYLEGGLNGGPHNKALGPLSFLKIGAAL